MAMQESVGSLKAYFIIVGLLSGLSNAASLRSGGGSAVAVLLSLIGVGFGLAYLYIGFSLKTLLTKAPGVITGVLIAGAVYLGIIFLLGWVAGGRGFLVVYVAIGLGITWYLFSSVRRLAS